jgi:GT2 family glycosyltransferase
VDAANPLCLITANLAVRRDVFDKVGLFAPELQRVKDGIGSMEDHEFLVRCFRAGCRGWYAPEITVTTEVPWSRTQKGYHRRWHRGHGYFYAIMRSEDLEPASAPRLFDVPAYLYKQAVKDCAGWLTHTVLRNETRAGTCEMRLQFFMGFLRTRGEDFFKRRVSPDAAVGKRDART